MTSPPGSPSRLVEPPRLAVLLLDLFATTPVAECILGDLLEEFSLLAWNTGIDFARRWYWRQTLKTVFALAVLSVRTAPWFTAAAVVAASFLKRTAFRLVDAGIFFVLERYQVYEHHLSTYLFFASTGIDFGYLLACLLVGLVVALAARGREMVITGIIALIYAAMTIVAVVVNTGHHEPFWRLLWYFSDGLAVVLGGVIVRAHRSAAALRLAQP